MHFKAQKRGNEYILNGTKLFVTDAKAADYILVAARTMRTQNPEEGITLFMVNAKEWGVYMENMTVMDQTRKQYEVRFTNVSVPASSILGELHNAGPIVR